MTSDTLLAIDQGTTSSRAILFSAAGEIIGLKQKELNLHYPNKGWVEQFPQDIWQDTLWAIEQLISDHPSQAANIAAAGITNQRETTIVWDRKTGAPVYNAIVWQDRRTASQCEELKAAGHELEIRARTGLLLDPYFSATKIEWILNNVEGAMEKAHGGELAFGTVDSWLLWNLSGGKVHATDVTNASRTMLYNIQENCWDDHLLNLFNIPVSMLPEVHDNVHAYAQIQIKGLDKSITVGGIAGDQQSALIGQACFQKGMVKSTYGTGCFALMNIGHEFYESKNRLLTTPAYCLNGKITYAIEGSIFVAGAAVQWLRDGLHLFQNAEESESIALSVENSNGVYFVPAFTGLGAPYWEPGAKAAILGLSRESSSAHITRAALEAQAYQTRDLMVAMQGDTGAAPEVIRADGGLVNNKFVCQYIADILGTRLEIPKITETTALGAAYLAGLYAGVYESLDDISGAWAADRQYEPACSREAANDAYAGWQDAIRKIIPD
jgi:glycerol kinase